MIVRTRIVPIQDENPGRPLPVRTARRQTRDLKKAAFEEGRLAKIFGTVRDCPYVGALRRAWLEGYYSEE